MWGGDAFDSILVHFSMGHTKEYSMYTLIEVKEPPHPTLVSNYNPEYSSFQYKGQEIWCSKRRERGAFTFIHSWAQLTYKVTSVKS